MLILCLQVLDEVRVALEGAERMASTRYDTFAKSQVKILGDAMQNAAKEKEKAQAQLGLVQRSYHDILQRTLQ